MARLSSRLVPLLVLVSAAVLAAGCAGGEDIAPAPSSIEQAFEAAHPDGAIPPGLQLVPATRDDVAALVEGVVNEQVRVVLPTYLPDGFTLAAPYIAVGSGGARPNPEGWGDSYRVSYTDGTGLVVMTVGAEDVPPGLEWRSSGRSADGRALRSAVAGTGVVVATLRPPWIVVAGEGVTMAEALRVARSLAPVTRR